MEPTQEQFAQLAAAIHGPAETGHDQEGGAAMLYHPRPIAETHPYRLFQRGNAPPPPPTGAGFLMKMARRAGPAVRQRIAEQNAAAGPSGSGTRQQALAMLDAM